MTEYKDIKAKEFRRYIDSVLKKRTKSKSDFDNEKDQIQTLMASQDGKLFGNIFYLIINKIEEDIDKVCDILFHDYVWELLDDVKENETKLAKFIYHYTRSDEQIAKAAGIQPSQFNRVKNKKDKDFYAHEVFGLAKTCGLKPSQLFHYFYGDGERPVVG